MCEIGLKRKSKYVFDEEGEQYVFLKIGNKDALDSMFNGTWWFQHPAYYQKEYYKKNDTIRGDDKDSKLFKRKVLNKDLENEIVINLYQSDDSSRIICFYKLKIDNYGRFFLPTKKELELLNSFGQYVGFVDILRLKNLLEEESKSKEKIRDKFTVMLRNMFYLPDNETDKISSFTKSLSYAYQNEARIKLDSIAFFDKANNDEIVAQEKELCKYLRLQEESARRFFELKDDTYSKEVFSYNDKYMDAFIKYLDLKIKTRYEDYNLKDCISKPVCFSKLFKENQSVFSFIDNSTNI